MPSEHPCPPADEYQQLLSGVAPPERMDALASHLDTCPHCAGAIQTLLSTDTLGTSVRSAADLPALRQLPAGVLSKLLALATPRPSEPDLEAPTITREPSGPAARPSAAPSRSGEGATDASWAEPRVLADDTLFTPSAMGAPQKPGEIGVFAGYRVIEALGQGGMGVVYLAEDVQLQRRVALKVMKPDLAASDSARQRFLAEARAAARIRSDYVVTIYQTGEHGGAAFAAMELLRGSALDGWLKAHRGAPVAELLRIGREAALGLAAAHDEGLVHRDIKPGNIWVETSGRVKILDFGLARSAEGGVDLTKSGAVIGTPAYMAPEQARGERVDHRADLFSLGCVLYRMTTGKMPFKGDTVMGVLTALAVDHPDPAHEQNPAVPPRLSALIARLLAKSPADRPQTARAVADELQAIAVELTAPAVVPMAEPVLVPAPSDFDFDARTEVTEPARPPKRAKARAAAPAPDDEAGEVPAPRARRPLVLAAVAAALLLTLGVVAAQLIFTTADGTLIVEVDDTADVRFRKGKLEIYDENGTLKYTLEPSEKNRTLPPGKYQVKVVGADGVKLETESFELQRKGQAYVRVRAVPGGTAVAANAPKKPAPQGTNPPAPGPVGGTALTLSKDSAAEAPDPGVDPKKPWTLEGYVTPLTKSALDGGGDLLQITGLGGAYFKGSKYGVSVDGFQLGAFLEVGKRVHVAVVRADTRVSLFVDGKLCAGYDCKTQAEAPAPGPGTKLRLGPLTADKEFAVQEVRVSQAARYTKDFTPPGRHVPDKDTLALYHLDEGQGDKLADSSGNNRHGKIANPKWGTTSAGTPESGARYALHFDIDKEGTRWNHVEMATLKLSTTDPVTIEGWVKMDVPHEGPNNVLFGGTYQLGVGRGGGYFYPATKGGEEPKGTGVPPLDVEKPFFAHKTWQHVAVVRDADEVRTYLDGKLVGRAACKGPLTEGAGFVFGNAGKGLSVREVRVSAAARYSRDGFTPEPRFAPDKQTLALYHCDEGKGEQVADSSGNGHHGKISGFGPECMTKWVTLDGAAVGPGGPVTQPPSVPAAPLALRKPTWRPGPADNILSGLVPRPAILDTVGRWQVVPTVAPTWAVSFSPDAKWVATHDDVALRVYDARTGVLTNLFLINGGQPLGQSTPVVEWSHDSRWLKWGTRRPTGVVDGITFAATDASAPVAKYETSSSGDFGWNPKFAVVASLRHSTQDVIEIIDPTQAKPTEIDAKMGPKGKAVWSPNGEWLLVVREDKTAQLFARDGTPGAKLAGEVDPAVVPAWSADGKQIAALTGANEVGFWKADGTAGARTGKHEKPVLTLHWKPDGKLLAASDAEFKRHFWRTDGTSEWVVDTKDATPGLTWAKDGKGFFTSGKFWPAVGNPSFTVTRAPDKWEMVSPDQASVALAKRGVIEVVELADGAPRDIGWAVPQTRDGAPWWSPDGKRLAVADQNGVSLYDARDPKKVVRLGGGAGVNGFHRAAFSPKGDRLAVANDIGHLFICEPAGKVLRALSAPARLGATLTDAVHDLSWHPDGKLLAVTTGVGTVTVFDTETGKVEATASVQGARSGGSAIFSPANPDHLLIAHPDQAALWRWKVEKEPLQKYAGLGKLIPSPDGKRVLSLQAGAAHHGNEYVPPALLSADLKDRSPLDGKEYMPANNMPGAAPAWHPDGKHLIVTRLIEARSIQIRSLDGKVVEEIKPEGVDVTWLEWLTPAARRNVLVGRIGPGPDHYLFDVATKKLTAFGKVPGEVVVSPDGKYLIALEGSTLTYWNVEAKAIEQRVVLLPNGEFVTLSVAGEVLEKSAGADSFYRYVVEDKSGKLLLKTPAEMAPLLPQGGAPVGWAPTAEQQAFLAAVAALPANERPAAVLRKMRELNPVGFSERPPVELHWDPKDGEPTSCRVTSPIMYVGWPLAALTSLKKLDLTETHILDFRPLAALPLEEIQLKLILDNTDSEAALKAIPTLKTINGTAAKDFWAERAAVRKDIDKMATSAAALSLEDQTVWLRGVMRRLHPGVPPDALNAVAVVKGEDGRPQFRGYDLHPGVYDFCPTRALPVESFFLLDGNLFDATPLGRTKGLKVISLNRGNGVTDLSPLAGLQLTELFLAGTYSDLRPLQGMPLRRLAFNGTPETDLSPLKGMPLESLELGGAKNLAPLAGLPLKKLVSGHYSPIDDLSPLKGMPLETLLLHRSKVTDISPLAGIKFKEFSAFESPVADYAPLKGSEVTSLNIYRGVVDPVLATLPLKSIELLPRLYSPEEEKVLRGMKLETINGLKPEDFWKDIETRRRADAEKTAEMAKVPPEAAALEKALWAIGQYPKVKIEGGAVVEVEAGHANGGVDNRFAVLLAFPKIRKLKLDSGGDYSALSKLTELEELTCPPLEVGFNRLTLKQLPKLKTINGKPAKEVLGP